MPPSWHPVPACVRSGCCRRNHSSLPLRRLESDTEDCCRYERIRRNHSPLHRFPSLGLKSRIDARKRVKTGKSLHRFSSLALKSRIDARKVSESVVSRDFQAIRIENLSVVFPHPQRKYPGIVVHGYVLIYYNVCVGVISGCGEP